MGSGQCWCLQVEVDPEALAELTGGSGDCLCPQCLPLTAPAGNLRSAPVTPPRGA